MNFVQFTKQKLACLLAEVERLKGADFPHTHGFDCLQRIEALFRTELGRVDSISSTMDRSVQQAICLNANTIITRFHKLLGFILRSTNVRNGFEFFDPLLRLARNLLGPDAKLVLSSEWEFSPFTFAQVFPELPEYVFIGLPASESSNSLIVPLAGHELGHTVWRTKGIAKKFDSQLQSLVIKHVTDNWVEFEAAFGKNDLSKLTTDMFLISRWTPAYELTKRQSEEIFCDCLGIRLFGESFLHSFEYLVGPNLGQGRTILYPPMAKRTKYMVDAASKLGFTVDPAFPSRFTEAPFSSPQRGEKFIVETSDRVTEQVVPELINAAAQFADDAGTAMPTIRKRDGITEQFKSIVPSGTPGAFSDIINAGWTAFLNQSFWDPEVVPRERKFEVLNELIMKTIEVLEFQTRMSVT